MDQIVTYLSFNGNCREAMEFYRECLGGELQIRTLGDTPQGDRFPQEFKAFVVQASLSMDRLLLLGTDMMDGGLVRGNSVSILLEGSDPRKMEQYYHSLGKGCQRGQPLDRTHWGELFGGLVDRYGNHWLFKCKNTSF